MAEAKTKAKPKALKHQYLQSPDDLCAFVNENKAQVVNIVPFNGNLLVFYY